MATAAIDRTRMIDPRQPVHIEPARPDDWAAALHVALARVPEGERPTRVRYCLDLVQLGTFDPRGIWVARAENRIVAAQVCVPLPGSTSLFWLPASNDELADRLVLAALDWTRSAGCKIAQALAHADDATAAGPLLRSGFRSITRMHQLAHDLANLPANGPTLLRFEPYRPALAPLFAATLERTYDDTLDCPELNGKRTIDEILAGHRGQGKFHPDCWWLAYDGADAVGVVMLVEMLDCAAWELAYLGIVPEHRRRRLGRTLSLHALHAARAVAATRLMLAVDARNLHALRLYQALGFVEVECQEVLLYFW